MQRQVLLWTSSIDPDSLLPSQWSFWGYDYASQRGVGNYYTTNDVTLFTLIHTYLRVTGDAAFLNLTYEVGPFPNGTYTATTVFDTALALATHWKAPAYNASGYLADYGLAPNLLECVPTYIHRVASLNAGNAFMANALAPIAESFGNAPLAAALRADADAIAAAVLARLYVAPGSPGSGGGEGGGGGFFRAEYLNGTTQVVRHVMDYVYVSSWLQPYLNASVQNAMAAFVARELLVPHWMRALSLNDTAAPLSNRSDHGPSGAYIGWPALTVRSLGLRGTPAAFASAAAFLRDTLFVAELGPYGQAVEIRPPGAPYKPFDVTLYNCLCAAAFADTVMQTVFGWAPPLHLGGGPLPPPQSALAHAGVPRGVRGVLSGVEFLGRAWDVVSGDAGLSITAHA